MTCRAGRMTSPAGRGPDSEVRRFRLIVKEASFKSFERGLAMRVPLLSNQVSPPTKILQMQHRFPLAKQAAIAAAALALMASGAALAQGGKAEPLRISFKRGAYSATISDSVHGDEEAEYVLAASEGQRLTIKLTSVPDKSSVFELLEDNDTTDLLHDLDVSYSGVLPKTGDYFITVKRATQAKGTSRFRLTVAVH